MGNLEVLGGGFDYKEFQKLSNSPEVQSSLNKILEKCGKEALKKERAEFEKQDISKTFGDIIKQYPDLWMFLSGELKLNTGEKSFKNLTGSQKVVYTALWKTFMLGKTGGLATKMGIESTPKNGKEFRSKYAIIAKNMEGSVGSEFKLEHLQNLGKIEKTLTEYGLTSQEIKKFTKYLNDLKDYPDPIQKAGFGAGIVVGLVLGAVLTGLGIYWYDSITKPQATTNVIGGDVEIENPEAILKLLTQEGKFQNSGLIKKELFTENEDGNFRIEGGKKLINKAQSTEIKMKLDGKLALQHNLDGSKITYNTTSKILYVKLPAPTVVITESRPHVLSKNREWIQVDQFNNAELELVESLKKQVLEKATIDGGFYDKAKSNSRTMLFNIFKSAFSITGQEIKDVVIDMEKPQITQPYENDNQKINIEWK